MYNISKLGHPTEATALHKQSSMRIVVGYDAKEDAYRSHLYVKKELFDENEIRVPLTELQKDETAALEYAYEAGIEFIDRLGRTGFQTQVPRDLPRR